MSHLLNARLGRKWCMVIAGFWFTVGAVINCAAQDLGMLYVGRILLGFGVGFANQSVSSPLHLIWPFVMSDHIITVIRSCHDSFHAQNLVKYYQGSLLCIRPCDGVCSL